MMVSATATFVWTYRILQFQLVYVQSHSFRRIQAAGCIEPGKRKWTIEGKPNRFLMLDSLDVLVIFARTWTIKMKMSNRDKMQDFPWM